LVEPATDGDLIGKVRGNFDNIKDNILLALRRVDELAHPPYI